MKIIKPLNAVLMEFDALNTDFLMQQSSLSLSARLDANSYENITENIT